MSNYKLSTRALQDLVQIRRFTLKHWGEKQSRYYLEDLKKTLGLLAEMPSMGKSCSEELKEDVHRFLYGSHAIYYIAMPNLILIIAILHQSMVPTKHLDKTI